MLRSRKASRKAGRSRARGPDETPLVADAKAASRDPAELHGAPSRWGGFCARCTTKARGWPDYKALHVRRLVHEVHHEEGPLHPDILQFLEKCGPQAHAFAALEGQRELHEAGEELVKIDGCTVYEKFEEVESEKRVSFGVGELCASSNVALDNAALQGGVFESEEGSLICVTTCQGRFNHARWKSTSNNSKLFMLQLLNGAASEDLDMSMRVNFEDLFIGVGLLSFDL